MKNLKQWIVWKSVSTPGKVKSAKVPYDPVTNKNIDAQDPNNWMTFNQAKSHSPNVGFVLTKNEMYFCVDLDNSFVDGEWTQHAKNVCTYFPGIYTEISYSGKGLHLFGKTTSIPPHRNRIDTPGAEIELYFNNRFIAYTETGAVGDCNLDFTDQLAQFISVALSPDTSDSAVSDGLYGGFLKADSEWLGPSDDDELISRMLKSKQSPVGKLNGKASFKALWNANESVLSKAHPSGTDIYDRSSADAALFAHLAFWTGRDGPRMDRIARKSGLMRPKWDSHKDYLTAKGYTISKACARAKDVYRNLAAKEKQKISESSDKNYITGSQLFSITNQVEHFKGCVYILDKHCIFTPKHGVLTFDRFDVEYGGASFSLDHDFKKQTTKASEAFTKSQGYRFPKVFTGVFRPEHKTGKIINIEGQKAVNTYIPVPIKYGTGSVKPFLDFLGKLFPNKTDMEIQLCYMAALVQYPGAKFHWCPVVQGTEGNGKSLIMKIITKIIGERHCFTPQTDEISSKFNPWIAGKLFISVEEIYTPGKRDIIETLKTLITEERIAIQPKHQDQVMADNRANFYMTTNYQDAIPKTTNTRRYSIFYCPQQTRAHNERDGLTIADFIKLNKWLEFEGYENIAGYLKRYNINPKYNPATECRWAPDTSTTNMAITASLGIVEQEIMDAVEQELPGFKSGWISSYALTKHLEKKGLARSVMPNKRGLLLEKLGYIKNPWTKDGRASTAISNEDNTRPILYINKNMMYNKPSPDGATADYQVAQIN